MRKTSALTWTLLLLVLLPTGVLAWLGLRSVESLDADRLVDLERLGVREREAFEARVPNIAATLDDTVRKGLAPLAEALALKLPGQSATEQVLTLRGAVGEVPVAGRPYARIRVWRIELLGADGRSLLPAVYEPGERSPAASDMSMNAFVAHLGAEADRAYYGNQAGAAEAALAVWQRAETKATSDVLRMRLAVEAARVRARAGLAEAVAAAEALEERWSRTRLLSLGRPTVLLWLAGVGGMAPLEETIARYDTVDPNYRALGRLGLLYRSGAIDSVPLTREERAQLRRMARRYGEVPPRYSTRAVAMPAGGGAQLVFFVERNSMIALLKRQLEPWSDAHPEKTVRMDHESYSEIWPRKPLWHGTASEFKKRVSWTTVLPIPGDDEVRVEICLSRMAYKVARERRDLRWWTYGAIGMLLLVTMAGVFLLRRAVLREREARRVRDDFIANVTHEVRTPLTSVLLHSELLIEQGEDDAKRRQHAAVVQAQGQRLAALVGDMLDFAALERGTRTLENSPVDLAAACRDAIAPYQVLAEREGAEVTFVEPEREAAAMADPAALARILGNLVGNAWKHGRPSRDGHAGRLRILTVEDARGGIVEVRDDGPGIPAEERERVFERFGRGRAALRKEGSGIGLSLSRDLARAMGGDLTIHEEQGETVFRLRLAPVPELDLE